jgi:hypothetical protein
MLSKKVCQHPKVLFESGIYGGAQKKHLESHMIVYGMNFQHNLPSSILQNNELIATCIDILRDA